MTMLTASPEMRRAAMAASLKDGALHCTARSIKATIVLPVDQFVGISPLNGQRMPFSIAIGDGGHKVSGHFTGKGFRRVLAAIAEHGPENIVVIAEGNLVGNQLASGQPDSAAGISAQIKGQRPAADL